MPAPRAESSITARYSSRRRDGHLLSAVSAVAGGWLGGYAGHRIGVAITESRGQRGLEGVLLESMAAVVGMLALLWLLVLVALAVAGRSKPIFTATLAAVLGAVGLVAVVLLEWIFAELWRGDSTPGWYDGAVAVLLTLVMAVGGSAARRFTIRPSRRGVSGGSSDRKSRPPST